MIKVDIEKRGKLSRLTRKLPPEAGILITFTKKDFLPTGEQVASLLKWKSKTPEGILIEREPIVGESAIYEPLNGPEIIHTADQIRLRSTLSLHPASEVDLDYLTERLKWHWKERHQNEEFSEKKIKGLSKVKTVFERNSAKKSKATTKPIIQM
jgi:hypothetical protein